LRQRLAAAASVSREDDTTVARDPHEAVREAVAGLGDTDRTVVTMRYWDELSVDEIATALGSTPNAVSIRLHRARRRLADRLGGEDVTLAVKDGEPAGHVVVDGARSKEQTDDAG
jgi:DNA-directed RNA polymerase specialized sigma24 family protein